MTHAIHTLLHIVLMIAYVYGFTAMALGIPLIAFTVTAGMWDRWRRRRKIRAELNQFLDSTLGSQDDSTPRLQTPRG